MSVSAESSPRAWGIGLLVALALCSVIGGIAALTQLAGSTTFSIVAQTDTLAVRPACADRVVWDLPPGTVHGARAEPPAPKDAARLARPVTLAFGESSTAMVVSRADRRLHVSVRRRTDGRGETERAKDRDAITVTVQKEDVAVADESGIEYVSAVPPATAARAGGQPRWPLTLRLTGRVVVGDAVPEGGGWSISSVPILRGGHILAYGRAVLTGERLTLLSERIDPGTMVDTHPAMSRSMPDGRVLSSKDHWVVNIQAGMFGCAPGAPEPSPSVGFVTEHRDGGLEVVLYRTGPAIGLAPLGGPATEVGITRWDRFAQSPVLQIWAASLVLISVFLSVWTTMRDLAHLRDKRSR